MRRFLPVVLFAVLFLISQDAHAVKYGLYEGDARDLVPSAVVRQNSQVQYNEYANSVHGRYLIGVKDAIKATGNYKTVTFDIAVFNSRSKSAQSECKHGDMNRCALEYDMLFRATNHFEPGKVMLIGEQRFMQTNISEREYKLFRKPAAKDAFASYHVLEYTFSLPSYSACEYHYLVHAGNVHIKISGAGDLRCDFGPQQNAAYELVGDILGRLPRTEGPEGPPVKGKARQEPEAREVELKVEAAPSLLEVGSERMALIPASEILPAKVRAKTAPGVEVAFEITEGQGAELRSGAARGNRISLKADGSGVAEAFFFYTGGNIKAPLTYEVRVTAAGRRENVKVLVGLGLAFDRIVALKADRPDTHVFTLSVKSRFHPKLDVANYLFRAHESGLWGDRRMGIKLRTTWVNAPEGAPAEPSFQGTTRIARDRVHGNVLVVASGEPQYYQTNYAYPAVVMQSDGRHAYRINGGVVLLDPEDREAGYIREAMEQGQALAIVARDTPEHWLTSLACSLEAQDEVQYVLLETAKMLPGGDVVEALTTATGLMCKFGQGEYESLFYDLGTIIGGKYLDHLNDPQVFSRLTPRQQQAAKLAKKAYDELDEYKQRREREKWLEEAGRKLRERQVQTPDQPLPPGKQSGQQESPAAKGTPSDGGQGNLLDKAGEDLRKGVEELRRSFEDLGRNLRKILK